MRRWLKLSVVALVVVVSGSPWLPALAEGGQVLTGDGTWPLSPRPSVAAGFDAPDSPWAAGHRGVDLVGHVGQPVVAALSGTVSFVGSVAGKPVVVVDHGATRTTYEPVAGAVEVGVDVPAGVLVGHLVAAGSHCPPVACLHLGWIRNLDDVYLDPLALFGVRRVRLWPWAGGGAPGPAATSPDASLPRIALPRVDASRFGDLTAAARVGGEVGVS